jgi:hypothetical protein
MSSRLHPGEFSRNIGKWRRTMIAEITQLQEQVVSRIRGCMGTSEHLVNHIADDDVQGMLKAMMGVAHTDVKRGAKVVVPGVHAGLKELSLVLGLSGMHLSL